MPTVRCLRMALAVMALVCCGSQPASWAGPADLSITVDKTTNSLTLYRGDQIWRHFSVATGRTPDLTPEGTFPIVAKLVNPYYRKENIPGGDPGNPLGKRWLGLGVGNTGGSAYGIHGNSNPASIGKYISAGCIRMHNEEVDWLFDQVPIGTKVTIFSSNNKDAAVPPQQDIAIILNQTPLQLNRKPYLAEGRLFVPLRPLAEALGWQVRWEGVSQQAELIRDGESLLLTPATVAAGVSFVPLRETAKLLDITVAWEQTAAAAFISATAQTP